MLVRSAERCQLIRCAATCVYRRKTSARNNKVHKAKYSNFVLLDNVSVCVCQAALAEQQLLVLRACMCVFSLFRLTNLCHLEHTKTTEFNKILISNQSSVPDQIDL